MRKAFLLAAAIALISQSAFAQLQSTVVAGSDNGSTRRIVKTDSSGRLEVVGAAAGGVAYGPDTQGAAPTQAPITIGCLYLSSPATVTNNQISRALCDANGRLQVGGTVTLSGGSIAVTQSTSPWVVGQATASSLNAAVVGNVASAATDSGNPVKAGAVFNTTPPTVTNGQRVDAQATANGYHIVSMATTTGSPQTVSSNAADAVTNNSVTPLTVARPYLYNGTTWDRSRSIEGVSANTGIAAVATVPNTSANTAITPVVSTAVEGSHILKASAGNLYGVAVTTAGTAGYLLVFNATSAPADGAVTPLLCRAVGAYSSVDVDYGNIPVRYSTGITAVFSSTGCFTKTISATAMIEGRTQ